MDNSKPINEEVDFSPYILRELLKESFEKEALVQEFTMRKSKIKSALNYMIAESRDGITYTNTEDLFRELDEDEDYFSY